MMMWQRCARARGAPRSWTSLPLARARPVSTASPITLRSFVRLPAGRSPSPSHSRSLATTNTAYRAASIRSFHLSAARSNENKPNDNNKNNDNNKDKGDDKGKTEFNSPSEYFRSKEFKNTMLLTIGFTIIFTLLTCLLYTSRCV